MGPSATAPRRSKNSWPGLVEDRRDEADALPTVSGYRSRTIDSASVRTSAGSRRGRVGTNFRLPQKSSCKMVDWLGETPPPEPDNATVARKQSNSHRVASVSQELLEEVAKPRWIAAAIAPAAVCHSGSLCLMALNVLLGWQLLFRNILKRSLAVDPKIFALLLSPHDPV